MSDAPITNNSKRRAARRRAVRASTRAALEREFNLPAGSLQKTKQPRVLGYASLWLPTKPGPSTRQSYKKRRLAARAERSRAKKKVRR